MIAQDIKKLLFDRLKLTEIDYIAVKEVSLLDAGVVADVFVINGTIHIYEIKSRKDNLQRLENQIEQYVGYSNSVTIVADIQYYNRYKVAISDLVNRHDIELQILDGMNLKLTREQQRLKSISASAYSSYWTSRELYKAYPRHKHLGVEQLRKYLLLLKYDRLQSLTLDMLKNKHKKHHDRLDRKVLKNISYYQETLYHYEVNMPMYIPRIALTAHSKKLFEVIRSFENTVPYIELRNTESDVVEKRVSQYHRFTEMPKGKAGQVTLSFKHFVDFIPESKIKYSEHAIKVYNLPSLINEPLQLKGLLRDKGEVGIRLGDRNDAEIIYSFIAEDSAYTKVYLFLTAMDDTGVINEGVAQGLSETAKKLTKFSGDNTEIVLMGSSVKKDYANAYLPDHVYYIENTLFNYYQTLQDSLSKLLVPVTVHYSDYMGYEYNTNVGDSKGFSLRSYPRVTLVSSDLLHILFLRISPEGDRTDKRDFENLQEALSEFIKGDHCKFCSTLVNEAGWTNNTKANSQKHNLVATGSYFDDLVPKDC